MVYTYQPMIVLLYKTVNTTHKVYPACIDGELQDSLTYTLHLLVAKIWNTEESTWVEKEQPVT